MKCWKSEHTPEGHATRLFQINYQTGVGQHILCSNTYEWQADYLVRQLKDAPDPESVLGSSVLLHHDALLSRETKEDK